MKELGSIPARATAAFEPEIRSMADTASIPLENAFGRHWFYQRMARGREDFARSRAGRGGGRTRAPRTLVHDDIMDEAGSSAQSAHRGTRIWCDGGRALGDALFAHALNLATQFPTTESARLFRESTRRVCAGRIMQTLRRGSTNITRADYQRIIDLRPPNYFAYRASSGRDCRVRARICRSGQPISPAPRIAVQIYDDLADFFGEEKRIGKTLGTDLGQRKTHAAVVAVDGTPGTQRTHGADGGNSGQRPVQSALHSDKCRTSEYLARSPTRDLPSRRGDGGAARVARRGTYDVAPGTLRSPARPSRGAATTALASKIRFPFAPTRVLRFLAAS